MSLGSLSADLPTRITIASRQSQLALWQAEHVKARLLALYPACEIAILGMTTEGDRILDRPLASIGGKGLFVKELEVALLEGRADLAVHSLKDVPMELGDEFALPVIMKREDPRDAFVSLQFDTLDSLPDGGRVGTSSLRRATQIRHRYPRLQVLPLRGNVNTRLAKLDAGDYDAIILAAAGLKRLGLGDRIRSMIPIDCSLPAAGQGALGIETLAGRADLARWLEPLADRQTAIEVEAERTVARKLGGNCRMPLAAFCVTEADGRLRLRARVGAEDGSALAHTEASAGSAAPEHAVRIGSEAAAALLAQGSCTVARVVLTQPSPRIHSIAARLRERGHEVLELALAHLDPAPPSDLPARVNAADWVIAVSPTALGVLFDALDAKWPGHGGLGLVGPGSRSAFEDQPWQPGPAALRVPEASPWDAAALMEAAPFDRPQGLRCLIVRGESGREDWIESLRSRGATVESVTLYRRRESQPDPQAIVRLADWHRERLPVSWVFTQASVTGQWAERLGPDLLARRARLDRALVIHPRIEAAARRAGFTQVIPIAPGPEALAVALES